MSRIANSTGRSYRSELRAEQAEKTRARIIDATVRVMASGIASLSIPAVAREAGVSIPTIYRHFGTKAELVAALYPHLIGRTAIGPETPAPSSMSDFRNMLGRAFAHQDELDDLARAAMASPAAEEERRRSMPNRMAMIRRFVAAVAPGAGDGERERITRLMLVLTSTSAMRLWRDYFESSAERAADDVEWILRAAIAAADRDTER